MVNIKEVKVKEVYHWSDNLFSIKVERPKGFNYENGHFCMIGVDGHPPIMRAYSIVSANYEDYLEFFSIKVDNGLLTKQLQNVKPGDNIRISLKSTGSLVEGHLKDGKNLYLISTGTGLAPFLSIIKDPFIYEKYNKIILTHTVRNKKDLAYQNYITKEIKENEYIGEEVKNKFYYIPTVTREKYTNVGRITEYIKNNKLAKMVGEENFSPEKDKFMICGSPSMLKDVCEILQKKGFQEGKNGYKGDYVIERAFVEK